MDSPNILLHHTKAHLKANHNNNNNNRINRKNNGVVAVVILTGTQLMPSVGFQQKNWRL
jgi:hypothetical protein